ncbi:peptide-methionine (S)-S-oxide reductase MsrA [Neolewinella antarctica]|uniref:Peptide methionine sulfoxide reductase MsrA n=1 Tax=Neolewinella antarctica TaxID=442734 RepID=A0ABX0XBN1_9BACT|nr:peptide-methionine (S)-S-oxide reductase MsrA [Neolewinella antarctica]NJC26617.1 peptide-methionine (S)-S-oxide reductase [Neolewinella antarctica]
MKIFAFPLLLIGFFVSLSACDSQKTNATNATTTETSTPSTNRASQPDLAGDVTIEELDAKYPGMEKAYLAGGCFWCTEASLDRIQGVADVWSGYAGGPEDNPTYRQVAGGQTKQAEAIVVYFDPAVIDYETILDVFFVAHNPTELNRQGPDVGTQYRSTIFPLNDEQRRTAQLKIRELDASGQFSSKIATTIEDPIKFWVAEGYHQDYYENPNNPNWSYVTNVSKPKVEKVMKVFRDRLKPAFL